MKLKSVELFGFKSFAERTVFELNAGVTAIVGPNGCGKSNVVDAVKWVLGEQRARSLRGREMADVIFNGSERRAVMDVAEVTLVFDNDDHVLPIDQGEVEITRRLYRSGDSEYLINKQVRRLRDIRELFMGTGLGPGGYSFMEQGKIDSILASNPVERRKVFEEAAGISRFRARRHEAELKLDKVDANLLRLADILEELARQQRSLKIQAGKAERYQEHSRRVSELQAQVALHRYHDNAGRLGEMDETLATLQADRTESEQARDEKRQQAEEIGQDLSTRSETLATLREQAAEVTAREQAANEMREFHSRHLVTLESREEERRQEIAELEQVVLRTRDERSALVRERDELTERVERQREELAEQEGAVDGLRAEVATIEEGLHQHESSLHALGRREVELDRETARLEAEASRWSDEAARMEEALAGLECDREAHASSMAAAQRGRDEASSRLEDRRGALARARDELEELEVRRAEVVESHREKTAERSRVAGRVDALEGHIARNEGLDAGVRAVLEEHEKRPGFLAGFRGLLIDLFRADLDHADAVEAALGELTQSLVVESVEEALEGAAFLRDGERGRAAFVALEAFASAKAPAPAGVTCEDEEIGRMLAALLEGVETLTPEQMRDRITAGGTVPRCLVTPQGDVVRDGRAFLAGRSKGRRGLIAVRAELEGLRRDLAEATGLAAELERSVDELKGRVDAAREQVRVQDHEVAELDSAWRAAEGELASARSQEERLAAEETRLTAQLDQARTKLGDIKEARAQAAARGAEVHAAVVAAEAERRSSADTRQERRQRLDEAAARLESQRVELATAVQRLEGMSATVAHLEERHDNAQKTIERYNAELHGFAGDRERSVSAVDEEEKKAQGLREEVARHRERIQQLDGEVGEIRRRHAELTADVRRAEERLSEVGEELHRAEMKANEVRVNQENLVEHIREELELDLSELHRDYEPADIDWDAIESELDERREKLRKIGNVNLAAIDDLAEVEERLEFLTVQRGDLLGSKQQLARVLNDIEAESTRLFNETFTRVREHFQVMFRKLFGGGRADITLLDPENVLESGIEITARPPGKEARSISLLSGGERTMTAVAMLFSIIRAHPCPCCLLDEVDAALDEDNTERFCRLLDEFLDRTQFVLITHSRRTMARADVLFGVTMGERGVSRRVGVRFEDVGENGEILPSAEPEDRGRPRRRRVKGALTPAAGELRQASPAAEPPADEHGHGNGNGNGNGNGQSRDAAKTGVAGEVMVEMGAAADGDPHGGRTEPEPAPLERPEEPSQG